MKQPQNSSGFQGPGSGFVCWFVFLFAVLGLGFGVAWAQGQAPALTLKATSANVAVPGTPVSITLFRWSSDNERTALLAALAPPPPAAAPAATQAAAPPAPAAGRGGRAAGRGARGGRGGAAEPVNPIVRLNTAIASAPTIGYLWTDGVTGYSIKYAWRAPQANGAERIVLATARRLGAHSPSWAVATGAGPAPDQDFTLIEMQLNARGVGEAKTSLTARVVADTPAHTLALDGYAAAPTLLKVTR
jgi:hypothetical protein